MGEQQPQGQQQRRQEQPAGGTDSRRSTDLDKGRETDRERELRDGKPSAGGNATEGEFERAPQPGLTPDS
jgi:hypothetical protein